MRYISPLPASAPPPLPARVAVMGSTGSIGRNTLKVMEAWKERFSLAALAAGRNIRLLALQAAAWRPRFLAILEKDGPCGAAELKKLLPGGYRPEILAGPEGYAALASLPEADIVVSAQSGAAGLGATLSAVSAGKTVCLANKESLVMAGGLIRSACRMSGSSILPVDSEHWAIFQCIAGRPGASLSRLILTASGGPFRTLPPERLDAVRPEDALKHPNWSMGAKITIDSATLMNKGLEVIEACHLYQAALDEVDVLIHPQSLVHSLVELADGSLLAQMAVADMRIPIAGALAWPGLLDREHTGTSRLDLAACASLTFEKPRRRDFPCLDLACQAFSGGLTIALNSANEVAVERFLKKEISFTDIPRIVDHVLSVSAPQPGFRLEHDVQKEALAALDVIRDLDAEARHAAASWKKR
ncbi:MAG: 1-deoxy-D-xylulose-5-phosphate reductoisomerase [Mailhella sp.]|nr:1-deoxy-D-xylulose-5-phosphate reductoisomerase [Mailhella sp.]